jgi:hypothetical protein
MPTRLILPSVCGTFLFLITAFAASPTYAQQAQPQKQAKAKPNSKPDFDFFFLPNKCSATVGFHVLSESDESVKTIPGDPYIWACTRKRKQVDCLISPIDDKSAASKPVSLTVGTDLGSWVNMYDPMHNDHVIVDIGQRTVVTRTRLVSEKFAGAKVCQGRYMTGDEFNALFGKGE